MPAADIREQVKDFKERYAHGDDIEDCFAPWYLTKTYGVSATEAIRCSAESKSGPNGAALDRILEFNSVTWPTRKQAIRISVIVFVFMIISAVILGLVDIILATGFEKLINISIK